LHTTVLKRMKTDDRKSSPDFDAIRNLLQSRFQRLQLPVHRNSQCLKCPSRRVDSVHRAWNTAAHKLGQLASCPDWPFGPLLDNPPDNSPTKPLFPKLIDQIGQFALGQARNQLPRRFSVFRIKSQIERTSGLKAEASFRIRQLIARKSQIEQHTVN